MDKLPRGFRLVLPRSDSRARRVLVCLLTEGEASMADLLARHTLLGYDALRHMKSEIATMDKNGVIKIMGDAVALTPIGLAAMRRVQPAAVAAVLGQIAGPRQAGIFTAPLPAHAVPSVLGTRPGSNDYRNWPSRQLDE